jgi:TATA-binding protein-associated factor Taf7
LYLIRQKQIIFFRFSLASLFAKLPLVMDFLNKLEETLEARKKSQPENSYTANLFRDGLDRILKKLEKKQVK